MSLSQLIFTYFQYFILIYFGMSSIYILIFAISSILRKKNTYQKNSKVNKIAVFIPCYKEDAVILNTAKSAVLQRYPLDKFDVIIIADSFQESTLEQLQAIPVRIINVSFKNSTKVKALKKALKMVNSDYDIALILDADNIMEPCFLEKINNSYINNINVIQGHRKAKNLNTPLAILDAISEEVNNNIFRQGHRSLGLSSALIGSGMAFNYQLLKKTLKQINAISGFDKELEFILIKQKITIEYLENAILYDEKTQLTPDFKNQRRRWLSSKVTFFKKYAPEVFYQLFYKGNITFADKIYQMLAPPRIILLGTSFLFSIIYLLLYSFGNQFWISSVWILIFITCSIAIIISTPKSFFKKKYLHAIIFLPVTFITMIVSMLSLKKAYKKFIHTPHSSKFN